MGVMEAFSRNLDGWFAYAARRFILAICTMVGGMRTRLT